MSTPDRAVTRVAAALLAPALAASTLTGCMLVPHEDAAPPASGGTQLVRALGRIAATDKTREPIVYDDTAALRDLVGGDPFRQGVLGEGFGPLLMSGAPRMPLMARDAETKIGFRPARATYLIAAGTLPDLIGVVAGGQTPADVTANLTRRGWRQEPDRSVGPDLSSAMKTGDKSDFDYATILAQFRADGDDLVYGSFQAHLAEAGHPAAPTLADDSRIRALADCAGDVVAFELRAGFAAGAEFPTAVAVGVARPKSGSEVPRAVTCISWPSPAAADAYAERARTDLTTGSTRDKSPRPFREMVQAPEVTNLGGDEHVVRWTGETPGQSTRVMTLLAEREMPGLYR